jgi:hypothetical protein
VTLPVRVRLTAWYAVLLAVIIAVLGAFLVVRLRADLVAGLDRTLRPAADQIALGYHEEGVAEVADVSGTVLSGEAGASQVLTPAGRVLVSYGDPVARTPMIGAAETRRILGGGEGPHVTTLSRPAGRFRVVARSVTRGRLDGAGRPVGAPPARPAAAGGPGSARGDHRRRVVDGPPGDATGG